MTFKEKRELLDRVVGYRAESWYDSGLEVHEVTVRDVIWWSRCRLRHFPRETIILIPDDMAERFLDAKWDFNLEQSRVGQFISKITRRE